MSLEGISNLKGLRWLNAFAFVGVVAANALAVLLPLGGIPTSAPSEQWPTLVTPASFAFSIWSVIYLWLFVFVLAQSAGGRALPYVQAMGFLFISSCLANVAWIFSWHYLRLVQSLLFMLVLLGTLMAIHKRLSTVGSIESDRFARWTVRYPLSLYLGWILVATVANTAIVFASQGYPLGELGGWVVPAILILLASGASVVAVVARDPVLPTAVAWGLAAIAVEQSAVSAVAVSAWVGVAILTVAVLMVVRAHSATAAA